MDKMEESHSRKSSREQQPTDRMAALQGEEAVKTENYGASEDYRQGSKEGN